MELAPDRCSIVLAGAWNLAIFHPDWVGGRMFPDEAEFEFGIAAAGVLHFQVPSIAFTATAGRLEFKPRDNSESSLLAAEEMAKAALRLLPETPLRACGVNLGLDEKYSEPLSRAFESRDATNLSEAGATLIATKVHRSVGFDGARFNFVAEHVESADVIAVDFNYHHDVISSAEALKALEPGILRAKARCVLFLEKAYGLRGSA